MPRAEGLGRDGARVVYCRHRILTRYHALITFQGIMLPICYIQVIPGGGIQTLFQL